MARWFTLTSAAIVALLVLAVPAQAGPLPNVVPGLPVPDGGDAQGLANEIRGEVQQFVQDQAGMDPTHTLKFVLEYAGTLQERVKQTAQCVKVDIKLSPDSEATEPHVTSGEGGDSQWITISTGNVMLRILVKDCIDSQSQSGPDP